MNKEFVMKKKEKMNALICVLGLRNPNIHFNLHNLYNFIRREEILTEEEIQEFDRLLNKMGSLQYKIQEEVFKDDY